MKKATTILVLSDFKTSKENILKSALNLAHKMNAEIHLFCVKKPIDVINKENQLSAMRDINKAGNTLIKDMQKFTQEYSEKHNIAIKNSFAFGNVKNEIERCISRIQPEAIVLGEKKQKMFNFLGDNITSYVLKNYKGEIVIAKHN